MIRTILIFLLAVEFSLFLQAQNLVPNPSFELYTACPNAGSQIGNATGWYNFGYTPDYYNACSSSQFATVPNNFFGYKPASTGSAYAGIYVFLKAFPNTREFIGSRLYTPLTIGKTYSVSFKVNLGFNFSDFENTAVNGLGVLFSTVPFSETTPAPVKNFAHVYTSSVITDTANWTIINGTFLADSAYEYLIIGNFFDDSTVQKIVFDSSGTYKSYYLIEDILVEDSAVGISDISSERIYASISQNQLYISLKDLNEKTVVTIINSKGTPVYEYKYSLDDIVINTSNFSSGLYFIAVKTNYLSVIKKIIIP